jgi:hypothetical protein
MYRLQRAWQNLPADAFSSPEVPGTLCSNDADPVLHPSSDGHPHSDEPVRQKAVGMLRRLRDLHAWTVETCDDRVVGHVDDFYLDDRRWIARFLAVKTTSWFPQRTALIPTGMIEGIDWDGARIVTSMTREDVRKAAANPGWIDATVEVTDRLRSVQRTNGCHIQALDGHVGCIEDLLADDDHWAIQYLAIDTSQWIGGSVLVPSELTRRIDSQPGMVRVDLLREDLKSNLATMVSPRLPSHLAAVGMRNAPM